MKHLRSGHGAGKGSPRIEVPPASELAPPADPQPVAPDRDAKGKFVKGNKATHARRYRPGKLGLVNVDKADPLYRAHLRWGKRYAAERRQEVAQAHGGSISTGVATLIQTAAMAKAASNFLYEQGASSGDAKQLLSASKLADSARQNELAAWSLASLECKARLEAEGSDIERARAAFQAQQQAALAAQQATANRNAA